jgi:Xaa-Pro dipeptidase
MTTTRIDKLGGLLNAAGLDALVVNAGPSLVYLTGLHFHLSERPVVAIFPAVGPPAIVLPELEVQKLADLPYEMRAFPYGEDPSRWEEVFRRAVQALKLDGRRIGVEPRQMRLLEFRQIRAGAPEADYPDASDVVGSLRVRKDSQEVAYMREAVQTAQAALEALLPSIRIGLTEKEVAGELVIQLLKHGSQPEMPFSPIVSAGPNSANPHAVPSDRKLKAGDLLVIDWGACVGGYISDLTRTFAVGQVDEKYQHIHQVVLAANLAGRQAGRAGIACSAVDRAARQVIETAGYGEFFTHRTGHGIGMEGHEEPYLRGDNPLVLETGMAYTVEPGIYLPGENGVRIEDNLVITGEGTESLSDMDRSLRVVGLSTSNPR